eukprot:1181193-Prorocentrum_minimum.AAC.4
MWNLRSREKCNEYEDFLDDARPPPTDPLGDASRRPPSRRSACPIAWRGRAASRKTKTVRNVAINITRAIIGTLRRT